MGDDIFDIFCEEVEEISGNLLEWFPQWEASRDNKDLLAAIRRAFHTLKGSGRMAGAFALGDFGWAHEDLLNQVIGGQIPLSDQVVAQIGKAAQELEKRLDFYQHAQEKDSRVAEIVATVESLMHEPQPVETDLPELALIDEADEITLDFVSPAKVEEASELEPDPNPMAFDPISDLEPDQFEEPASEVVTFDPISDQEPEAESSHHDETDDSFDAEMRLVWQLFWEELPEQLQSLDQNLQNLQDDPQNTESIRELEREFHTLKGGARMARLTDLADVSHEAEDLLCNLPRDAGLGEQDIVTLQQSVDQLYALAEQHRQKAVMPSEATPSAAAEPAAPVTEPEPENKETAASLPESLGELRRGQEKFGSLLERMLVEQADSLPDIALLEGVGQSSAQEQAQTMLEQSRQAVVGSQETIRLSAGFIDTLIDKAVGLNIQQVRLSEQLSSMGLDIEELTRTVARLRQQIRALEVETETQIHDGRGRWVSMRNADGGFDPLEMDQYAEVQRISRSLAESLSDLVNIEADLAGQVRKGEQLLQEDMRTTRRLRQDLLETRLVAMTMLVPRLRRLVRQTSGELGRLVTLEVQGEECELDRKLLQHMTPPLEHLIRNAIVHGIEPPDEREKLGKPRTGTVVLSVSRDDSQIVIRFRDDGRGLDRRSLYEKAVEMGLVEKGQTLPDVELDRLILHSGFSTAQEVSQIAGRGIGMDVVYSEVKAMGGSLEIATATGAWTEFTMRLPFTLVVNPVLLAEVQEQVYAVPINGIQGLARLSGKQVETCLQAEEPTLEFAGQLYPLKRLADSLGQPGVQQDFPEDEGFPVIFVCSQGQAIAWLIDRIAGRREVVLQPLGALFKHCRLYSAATVSSDGQVYLVPDMGELARQAIGAQNAGETAIVDDEPESFSGTPRIMVVDDSITVRRVTEKFLGTRDYQVESAKDGMEALEKVEEFRPDAILLDIEMPRMDGFELLGHLRRDPKWENLPVIMISSRTAQKHRERAGELGATGFLGKPYQNEVLLGAIEDVLSSGHEKDSPSVWEGAAV